MNGIKHKSMLFLLVLASATLFFHSCKNREPAKENTVPEQKIENSEEDAPENLTQNILDSADIRIELKEPVLDRDFETLTITVINNSEYRLSTGNEFVIKYLKSGLWGVIPEFENTIWTDEEIPVFPKSSREYEFFYGFYNFDFVPGKYRIEKNVKFVNPIESNGSHFIGERTLAAEFEIK
ncbi:MAG: hypothetical protein Q4G48_01645 [Bacteroidia bacterium]|nr:hypothetical protein [Bacteroidia bacterium]